MSLGTVNATGPAPAADPARGHMPPRRVQIPFLHTELPSVGPRCVDGMRQSRELHMKRLLDLLLVMVIVGCGGAG